MKKHALTALGTRLYLIISMENNGFSSDRKDNRRAVICASLFTALSFLLGCASVVWVAIFVLGYLEFVPFSGLPRFVYDSFMQAPGRPWLLMIFVAIPLSSSGISLTISKLTGGRPQFVIHLLSVLIVSFFLAAYFGLFVPQPYFS